jgi:hypothetical protein
VSCNETPTSGKEILGRVLHMDSECEDGEGNTGLDLEAKTVFLPFSVTTLGGYQQVQYLMLRFDFRRTATVISTVADIGAFRSTHYIDALAYVRVTSFYDKEVSP